MAGSNQVELPDSRDLLAAVAINELLYCAKWRVVLLALVLHESERGTELCMQLVRAIPHYRQAAAIERTVFSKSSDDDVTTGLHRTKYRFDIGLSGFSIRQEMKNSTVVPNIK